MIRLGKLTPQMEEVCNLLWYLIADIIEYNALVLDVEKMEAPVGYESYEDGQLHNTIGFEFAESEDKRLIDLVARRMNTILSEIGKAKPGDFGRIEVHSHDERKVGDQNLIELRGDITIHITSGPPAGFMNLEENTPAMVSARHEMDVLGKALKAHLEKLDHRDKLLQEYVPSWIRQNSLNLETVFRAVKHVNLLMDRLSEGNMLTQENLDDIREITNFAERVSQQMANAQGLILTP